LVTFGGYRANAGASNPSGSGATGQVPRVVGVLNLGTGVVNTTQAFATGGDQSYWNDSLRSVATDDGSRFWTSGASAVAAAGGVRYLPSTTATATVRLGSAPATSDNTRQVQVIDGRLFVSAGAAAPGRSVFQVGTGLPTAGDQTYTNTFPVAASAQYHSFYFTNLGGQNWNGTGFDTLYATDTTTAGGQLAKFSFDGTAWVANGTLTRSGLTSIVGVTNGSSVTLYGTDGGFLVHLVDGSGFNTALSGSFTPLLAAGAPNFAFRGIAFTPVPEPGAVLAIAAAGLAGWVGVRRRTRKPA
jgi:hypothetical protein